jgi:hypothetical protein
MLFVTVKLSVKERKAGKKMEGVPERTRKDKNREGKKGRKL